MLEIPESTRKARALPDWRGWIALGWAIGWGWAYGIMAMQARAPQLLTWLKAIGR